MLGIIIDFTDIPTAPNNYSFPFFPCPSYVASLFIILLVVALVFPVQAD